MGTSIPTTRLHAVTWLVWALAAVVCVQTAPNALYVVLVLLLTGVVVEVHGRDTALARAFPFFLALGALFGGIRVLLTVLTTHDVGRELFSIPSVDLPRILGGFTVGGSVELEVLLRAVAEAIVILTMIAIFGAWNAVVSHDEVLASTPRAFHEPGLIVTVALAFVPSTLTSVRDVREADRARSGGRHVRRGRLVRTLVPVLERGLERAVSLAESMDSRGFGRGTPAPAERVAGWCAAGGLLSLGGAFLAVVGREHAIAAALAVTGTVAVVAAVVVASRATRRVRYRPRRITGLDRGVMAAVALAPVLISLLAAAGNETLVWEPWRLQLPRFDLRVATVLLLLAIPAAVPPRRVATAAADAPAPERTREWA